MENNIIETEFITIGIPLYNMEQSIKNAIESCIAQTYTNFEILVVDDGSTDRSVEIVNSIKDPRVRLYKKEKNGGVCDAMNAILEQAKGKYLAILDADDLMMPTRIEKQYNAIKEAEKKHPNTRVACFCGSKVIHVGTDKITYIDPNNLFVNEFGGGTGHSMYKLSDIKDLGGFDKNFSRSADTALCIKFLADGGYYCMLKEPLIVYNFLWNEDKSEHSANDTNAFNKLLIEIYENLSNNILPEYNIELLYNRLRSSYRNTMKLEAKAGNPAYIKSYIKLIKVSKRLYLYLFITLSLKFLWHTIFTCKNPKNSELRNEMKIKAKEGNSEYINSYMELVKNSKRLYIYLLITMSLKFLWKQLTANKKNPEKIIPNDIYDQAVDILDSIAENLTEESLLNPQAYFIKSIINACNYKSYLELGIYDGENFLYVSNGMEVANCVDIVANTKINKEYFYNMTTDDYFSQNNSTFDLIYIDACHEYNQVVRDFENAANRLNKNGTIILHDTDPVSEEYTDPVYCDDSYRINDYLANNPEYNFVTLPFGICGITVVKRKSDLRYKKFINQEYLKCLKTKLY